MIRSVVLVGWVTLAVVASACSSSDESRDGLTEGSSLDVSNVAPSLEFLGDLAAVRSEPVTITFDEGAGSFDFGDGTVLDVPEGAFSQSTDLTAVVVDLAFERYLENPPDSRAYVVSTSTDVDLGMPVTLDVPVTSDRIAVTQLVDGQWTEVAVGAGPTIRVPIARFSEVPSIVTEGGDGEPAPDSEDPVGDSPGEFLRICTTTVARHLGLVSLRGGDEPTVDVVTRYAPFALNVCARALVDRYSPDGVQVDVGCVNDRIGGDVDLQAAIDACAAASSAGSDDDSDASGEKVGAPNGLYTGTFDDTDPSMFSPTADSVAFEPVSIEISGDTWTIQAGWSTTTDNVGGNCSYTATHAVTGSGQLTQDEGGYNLMAGTADGTVIDAWTTVRGGDGCAESRTDSGEKATTVFIFDEGDGSLTGTVDAHPVTLTAG